MILAPSVRREVPELNEVREVTAENAWQVCTLIDNSHYPGKKFTISTIIAHITGMQPLIWVDHMTRCLKLDAHADTLKTPESVYEFASKYYAFAEATEREARQFGHRFSDMELPDATNGV